MRTTLLSLGLIALTVALEPHTATAFPDKQVYLYSQSDLDRLRATNPGHYARAERIMAAANELCRPKPGDVSYAKFGARDISCAEMLLKTSNPPKRQISFMLDDTHYIALVVITDDPARRVHATR
ncbi:MAG TPA: hypothetical protein VI653_01345 [Steroidobacteraceae bacterium]